MDSKDKKIAKNTVFLYIRMIIIMLVTLYTTRVVLKELGVINYGVYNLVGSVAVSLIFVQNSLSSATQRYLSYEIGKSHERDINKVFSMSVNIHVILTLCSILFLETIGLWFVNSVLNIPPDRMVAANVAFQFSIFTFAANILRIPHNALLISNEMMNVYAVISIFEAAIRLGIAYLLALSSIDKLELYSGLLFVSAVFVNVIYWIFVKIKLSIQCRYFFVKDMTLFKKMTSFLGWNMIGGIVGIGVVEGPGYFINYYYGVALNAAIGIAKQINSAVYSLSSNFQSAFNPQIVKSYASKDYNRLWSLINNTSILSFFLLFIIAFPFTLCCQSILQLWLDEVPNYTYEFVVFMLASQFVNALGAPLWMSVHATGNIKHYQIVISLINIIIIPVSWGIITMGFQPYWVFCGQLFVNLIIYIYRIYYLVVNMGLNIKWYLKMLIKRCIIPAVSSMPIPVAIFYVLHMSIVDVIIIFLVSFATTIISFWTLGIDSNTKQDILNKIKVKYIKK